MNSSRHHAEISAAANGLLICGDITVETIPSLERKCQALLSGIAQSDLHCDLSGVTRLDTAGVLFLRHLRASSSTNDRTLILSPLPAEFQRFYDFVQAAPDRRPTTTDVGTEPKLGRLGARSIAVVDQLSSFLFLISDLTFSAFGALATRSGMRQGSFVDQAIHIGSRGLPIVALILFLIGAVSTLQAVAQLRQFGANVFAADLLAVGICRELGPLMTAIIVAGRSGSAIAAEIATMKFTEELDALKTMALDPLRLVAVPKLWAMVLTVPLLTIMADFMGILGGTVTGIFSLDLSPHVFFTRVTEALVLKDILTGLVKSISFAWAITMIAVFRGLEFSGGATGVGQATTSAVVTSIFGIIVLDLTWGLIFYLR